MPFEGGSAQGITSGPLSYVACNILNLISVSLFPRFVSCLVAYVCAEVIDNYGSFVETMVKVL